MKIEDFTRRVIDRAFTILEKKYHIKLPKDCRKDVEGVLLAQGGRALNRIIQGLKEEDG